MELKVKNLDLLAGRPIAILNDQTAKKMNVFADDRITIENSKKVSAAIDIFPKLVKKNEIGFSKELSEILKSKKGSTVKVHIHEGSKAASIIKKKLDDNNLSDKELEYLISEIVHNNLTKAEIAFFTSAEKVHGMTLRETVGLTKAMIKTGARLKFNGRKIADKHCIGGVAGNRTTPILVSICAATGLTVPKTSSRAITSASGTADVIETIANVELPLRKIKSVVKKTGACLAWGGSLGLAPSDDKIIQVERLLNLDVKPQLLASIISKKVSAGSKYIIIDVPYGKGAKIESIKEAKKLGRKFEIIGKKFNTKIKVVYTNGKAPIGKGFGPVLEMKDIIKVLQNKKDAPQDLKKKSIYLASELMSVCGIKHAEKKAQEILESGKAYEKFKEIVNAQNGKNNFEERAKNLRLCKLTKEIKAKRTGKIKEISNKKINSMCRMLGTPETIGSGIYLHKNKGTVKKGETILTLYSASKTKLQEAQEFYKKNKPILIR